jgi:hypothetical protein
VELPARGSALSVCVGRARRSAAGAAPVRPAPPETSSSCCPLASNSASPSSRTGKTAPLVGVYVAAPGVPARQAGFKPAQKGLDGARRCADCRFVAGPPLPSAPGNAGPTATPSAKQRKAPNQNDARNQVRHMRVCAGSRSRPDAIVAQTAGPSRWLARRKQFASPSGAHCVR